MKESKKIERLLFVDDDPSIRTVAGISLEGLTDWKIAMADSGTAALEMVAEVTPDVILLDMMMPAMDGIETFRRMQEIEGLKQIPVIFITAKVQPMEIDRYLRLGIAGVITKPFDPMTLWKQIDEIYFKSKS